MNSVRYDYDKQLRQSKRRRQLFISNAARIQKLHGETNLNNLVFFHRLSKMMDNGASPKHVATALDEFVSEQFPHTSNHKCGEERNVVATSMVELSNTSMVEISNTSMVELSNTSRVEISNTSMVEISNTSMVEISKSVTPLKRLRKSPRQIFLNNLKKASGNQPHLTLSPKQQQEEQRSQKEEPEQKVLHRPQKEGKCFSFRIPVWTYDDENDDDSDCEVSWGYDA